MEQLNFFDYLGLEQFEDDKLFLHNLPRYNFKIYTSEHTNSIIVEYKAVGEIKTRNISQKVFVENPGLYRYLSKFFN